jgi:hypothetical protein
MGYQKFTIQRNWQHGAHKTIKEWKTPRNLKEVEQFLGFVNYHRTFIKDLSKIAAPLTELTRKKPWKWGEEQQTAFEKLKSALQTTPVLAIPDKTGFFCAELTLYWF